MSSIFISYARSSEARARQIAELLRAQGYGVWRDDELPAHRAYAEVIAERLQAAQAVLVLWSADAARSEWVQSEADRARHDRKLVQLSLDGCDLPMPFDRIQCADLAGWHGDIDAPGWRKVLESLAQLTGAARPAGAVAAVPPPTQRPALSICVLPFANMSGDAEQEYFSDGISEDIITDLSKVSALAVTSRNSAFQFKGRHVDLRQVAQQLGVSHVLEGSVRKSGTRLRITAQLIEAAQDRHLWAERYDRELTDIFELQDELSQAIVGALRLTLLPAEKNAIQQRGTDSPEAYDLYLMARREWVSGANSVSALRTAVQHCQRATEIDPGYAQAWVQMALAQMTLHFRYGETGLDAQALAERALALDPSLAEAHAVKARYLAGAGRLDEANAAIDTALRLNPQSYEANINGGFICFRQRRLADAIRRYEAAAASMESSFNATGMLITCYQAQGDTLAGERAARQTLQRVEAAIAQDPANSHALAFGVNALAALGDAPRARAWAARALEIDPANRVMRYNLVCALATGLQDADGAIALLQPYLETLTSAEFDHVAVDPDLDSLREDERFKSPLRAAQERLGLAL
jgi:adenylate cyclase